MLANTTQRNTQTVRLERSQIGTNQYNLEPLTAYYKFGYTPSVGFQLGCVYPRHQWQFAVCVNNVGYNSYDKRQ